MKTLAIWFGKRYALSLIQDMVRAKADTVSRWSARVNLWAERAGLALTFLAELSDRLSDGELTRDEADATLAAALRLADEITGD